MYEKLKRNKALVAILILTLALILGLAIGI